MKSVWLIVAACAATTVGCSDSTQPGAATTTAAVASSTRNVRLDPGLAERYGVKVEAAGSRGASHTIRVPGTLEYNLEKYAEVGPLVDGRVSTVHVRVGDAVKKGQRLATLLVPSVAEAQADLIAARAASNVAERNATREERLLKGDLTTMRDAEAARGEQSRASAALAAAKARLQVMGAVVPTAESEIHSAGSLSLTSPIAGVVVRRDAVQGRYIRPAETAFVVADPSELWAHVDIFEGDLGLLKVGAEAELTVDALSRTLHGRVVAIEPQLGKSSRAARARIVVPNQDGSLRAGLFVRASITINEDPNARLLVPSSAVQPLGTEDVVFVRREPGAYEVRPVKVRKLSMQMSEVLEGVSRGEPIAVENAFVLRGEVTRQ